MRQYLVDHLPEWGYPLVECPVHEKDLLEAYSGIPGKMARRERIGAIKSGLKAKLLEQFPAPAVAGEHEGGEGGAFPFGRLLE